MSWCLNLSFISLVAIIIIYYVLMKNFTYWSRKGIPQYKFWLIWFKNVVEFIKQPPLTDAMQQLYKDFRGNRYVGTYQLFMPRLCIMDPDLIKQIFVKDFDHFVDHTMFIPTDGDPVWENSLFSLRGDKWRHMRAIASPSFTSSKMKFMFSLMLECAEHFMHYLDQQDEELITFEMKDIFGRITNDVFASTHFGVICDSLKERNNEMYLIGKDAVDFGGFWIKVRFVLIQMIPRITKVFGLKVFDQKASKFFKRVIGENMKGREKHKIARPDLIHLLMETGKGNLKNLNGVVDSGFAAVKDAAPTLKEKRIQKFSELTNEDITAFVMAFFGGGFDSTSSLLSFAAYELALQPEIQKKLQNEIDNTLETCKGAMITYEALMRMKYLDMVITETLRKWPGGFFLDRRCVKPYTINPVKKGEVPVHLKEGDSIWLSLFVLHRDPDFYPDPERFIPERFSDENKSNINPYVYMPFGIGPRHCIGNRFALMETKLVLFYILSKYNFNVVDKTAIPIRLERRNFQLTSKDGFWLGLTRRKDI